MENNIITWVIVTFIILSITGVLIKKMKKDGNFKSLNWFSYHKQETTKHSRRD